MKDCSRSLYSPVDYKSVDIPTGYSWPCLYKLGSIWFFQKGLHFYAGLSLVLIFLTSGVSIIVFPFFANKLLFRHFKNLGYLDEDEFKTLLQEQQGKPSGNKTLERAAAPPVHQAVVNIAQPSTPTASSNVAIAPQPQHPHGIATFTAPLAAANIQQQTEGALLPSQQEAVRITQPPVPTSTFNRATPPQPQSAVSLKSKSFIFTKLDSGISWKNEYDVLDAEVGVVLLELREGEQGSMTKIARMGTLATSTGFDIMFKTTDGQPCFRVKGGGMKGGGEVYNGSDIQIGSIKRAHLASMNFEGLDSQGVSRFNAKSRGIGVLTFGHDIRIGDDVIGSIKDINERTAKTILGANFDRLNNARKYDYAYHVSVAHDMTDLDKALLLAAAYCIAHISGRI